jgi:hypothetical protein
MDVLEGVGKKRLFLACLVLVFGSCEQSYYSVSITNASQKTVRFSYNGSADNLAPSESKTYSVAAYTQPPVFLGVIPKGPRSVRMERDGEGYKFVTSHPIPLHVLNTLGVDITITADYFIENGDATSLTVPKNTSKDCFIYTSTPKFTVYAQGYSPKVSYEVSGDEMYVTVR